MDAHGAIPAANQVDLRGASGVQVGDNPLMHVHVRGNQPPWWTRSGYIEQLRDIAPGAGEPEALRERDAELADLATFCGGDEEYLWLRAGPWAGKSALLSTFALNPPQHTEVVSFFITARLAGQSDSIAFTDTLIDQLSAIVGAGLPSSLTPAARDAHRRGLLRVAIDKLRTEGRRLVLVVDGLDEDRGGQPGSGIPSVASLLPKRCGDGLRVVVASRSNPRLPDDVAADHPLRRDCRMRELSVSRHATEIAQRASRELQELLHGDQLHRDILGLIAASGGGLTLSDLEELTGLAPYRLESLLGGLFGRTVGGRADPTGAGLGRVYLFTHETLANTAARHFGNTLATFRDRLHSWADRYRLAAAGQPAWTRNTPQYLLRGYARMLTELADTDRLIALATDSARHDLMLSLLGGDASAFAEIHSCQNLLLAQASVAEATLCHLARLSYHRSQIEARNSTIPTVLPGVWARIGQPTRGEALALGFTYPHMQARALAEVVRGLEGAGECDQAERIARSINDPSEQARSLAVLVWSHARGGEYDRAERIAQDIALPRARSRALARLAQALSQAGHKDSAEHVVRAIADTNMRARALGEEPLVLAWDAADPGEDDWTLISGPCESRAYNGNDRTPTDLESAYAELSASTEVSESTEKAWTEWITGDVLNPAEQAATLDDLVQELAASGEYDQAERMAKLIVLPTEQAWSFTYLARLLAEVGEPDKARRLAETAERVARDNIAPNDQIEAFVQLAQSLVRAGDIERARRIATSAERVARQMRDGHERAWALVRVLHSFVQTNEHGRAESIARDIVTGSDIDYQDWVTELIETFTDVGEIERAQRLIDAVDQIDPSLVETGTRQQMLAATAQASRQIPHSVAEIERMSSDRTGSLLDQARSLVHAVELLVEIGESERAQRLADQAERITQDLTDLPSKAILLTRLVRVASESEHARRLAEKAESVTRGITSLEMRAEALTNLAAAAGMPSAGRLVAEALAIGPWHTPLLLLAELYPQVVIQLADVAHDGYSSTETADEHPN